VIVERTMLLEDLVTTVEGSVSYLMKQGIKCIACGEPVWGTLEEAAKERGFSDDQIDGFVRDLNRLATDPHPVGN
jgi:methionine synthase II (cobalamin-independent)